MEPDRYKVKSLLIVARVAPTARRFAGFILLTLFLCAGCRREKIVAYRIPKDPDAPPVATETQPAAAVPEEIKYQLPSGWKQEAPAGMSMARFSFANNQGELSVMSFPGEGASQLNLINIVRENAGLPPLSDDQLARLVESVVIGSDKGSLVNLGAGAPSPTNTSPNSLMVAVLAHGGATWFFKLMGPPDVVTAQKPALLDFLKSVSFVPGTGVAPSHGQQFAAGDSSQMPAATIPPLDTPPSTDHPAWSVPADWHETSPGQMLLAKYTVAGAGGEAEISVSEFPGEVGGLLANVNRWRGQVGVAAVTEGDLATASSPLDVPGGKGTLVDVNGAKAGKPTRLIGIIWPRDGETWFYKMIGDADVAASQKDAFMKFVQSVHY